ncbi:three-helix bundle dimerization domain-containing protein [Gordonia hankookensis]|uniref:Uncharacterized protein n=1 Tax=Gordonia hankookensis TaxID=589403 RepID=A0ABR7WIE2_9ACTN|nr:hypothetical protein [Gordonia hankookensis]MBD1322470.1 hypothetical protein [Gordonia hankookensis]NDZ97581.1 hypothetical protein [Streptomyces sp. SID11726]NEB26948.1 hypothetical protein [Streptomyces sp. SID6673]
MAGDDDERKQITEVRTRLTAAYAGVPPDDVAAAVDDAYRRFDGTRVRDFVPLLVERRANQELGGSAVMADPAKVPPHLGE